MCAHQVAHDDFAAATRSTSWSGWSGTIGWLLLASDRLLDSSDGGGGRWLVAAPARMAGALAALREDLVERFAEFVGHACGCSDCLRLRISDLADEVSMQPVEGESRRWSKRLIDGEVKNDFGFDSFRRGFEAQSSYVRREWQ
jgi:hypothetical protein